MLGDLHLKSHYFHSELHPKGVEQSQFFAGQRRVIQHYIDIGKLSELSNIIHDFRKIRNMIFF